MFDKLALAAVVAVVAAGSVLAANTDSKGTDSKATDSKATVIPADAKTDATKKSEGTPGAVDASATTGTPSPESHDHGTEGAKK